jgi:hypothetical protein
MKTFTTLEAVLFGSFIGLVVVGSLPTFTSPVLRDERREVADNAGGPIQTADNAGGAVQTA